MDDQLKALYKRCPKCQDGDQYHPRTSEYWYPSKSSRDGFNSYCRNCRRQYQAQYHRTNYGVKSNKTTANIVRATDYIRLSLDEKPVINVIYSNNSNGRVYEILVGDDLPEKYVNLPLALEISVTATVYQSFLKRVK